AVGSLRPEGKQEVGEPPVGLAGSGGAVASILRAPGGIGEMVLRRPIGHGMTDGLILGEVVRLDMASVQKAEMRGIDLALERLQVIAVALDEAHVDLVLRDVQDLEGRQW